MPNPERVSVGTREINLTQLIKLVGWVGNGGEAKSLISEGFVSVNGVVELRKRRQMSVGDRVDLKDGPSLVVE